MRGLLRRGCRGRQRSLPPRRRGAFAEAPPHHLRRGRPGRRREVPAHDHEILPAGGAGAGGLHGRLPGDVRGRRCRLPSPEAPPSQQGYTSSSGARTTVDIDLEATSIAATMRGLRSLQLFASPLSDRDLTAILDGCARLVSLDIRQCFNVAMGGDAIRARCPGIQTLRLPEDSTDDYNLQFYPPKSEPRAGRHRLARAVLLRLAWWWRAA